LTENRKNRLGKGRRKNEKRKILFLKKRGHADSLPQELRCNVDFQNVENPENVDFSPILTVPPQGLQAGS
jgi:hypothetical protein